MGAGVRVSGVCTQQRTPRTSGMKDATQLTTRRKEGRKESRRCPCRKESRPGEASKAWRMLAREASDRGGARRSRQARERYIARSINSILEGLPRERTPQKKKRRAVTRARKKLKILVLEFCIFLRNSAWILQSSLQQNRLVYKPDFETGRDSMGCYTRFA